VLLLVACVTLLVLGAYVAARPEILDGSLGSTSSTRFKFVGTNRWTYMNMKLGGGGIRRIIRVGPIEVMVLDKGVEMAP
jgi:hypothetical protein